MSIETPFPAEGTIQLESEGVTCYSFDCMTEWFTEHESGDILERIKNDVKVNHGIGTEADVIIYESGRYNIVETREVPEVSA